MHPFLFSIGPFSVPAYGTCIAMGFICGIVLASVLARREGINSEAVQRLAFWALLGGLIGGRLLWMLVYWRQVVDYPMDALLSRTGFVFFGGLCGGTATSIWCLRRNQLPFWWMADAVAPAIALGQAFGRVGCFMFGCCHGDACTTGWGFSFPEQVWNGEVVGSPAYFAYPDSAHPGFSLPVYPTQLWSAVALLLLCIGLVMLHKRRHFLGQVFLSYLIAYGVIRFIIEIYRGDDRGVFLTLSTSQWISIASLLVGVMLYLKRRHIIKQQMPEIPEWAQVQTQNAKEEK
jgi:phosphatidylglycerol---prolipoprotein diacylglyceryl transferase